MQVVARISTTMLFDLKVRGRHYIPSGGGVLIVSNHQGNLDPVLLGVRLDRPLNYIAKSELFDGRWAVRLLRAVNAFPVRQGSGDVGAVKETIRRLRAGHVLNIYPEGQRTCDGEIGPLQPGVALIIRRAGVPVVPAAICGSYQAWPVHRRFFRPFPIRVAFGPPLDLNGLDADQIMAALDRTLHGMLAELRDWDGAAARNNRHATTPARSRTTCNACFEQTAPGQSDRCSWPPAPPASR